MRNWTFFSSPSKSTSSFRLKGVIMAVQQPSNLSSFIDPSSSCSAPIYWGRIRYIAPAFPGTLHYFSIMGQKNKISRRNYSQNGFLGTAISPICLGINAGSRHTEKSHTPSRPQLLTAVTQRLAAWYLARSWSSSSPFVSRISIFPFFL